jgi:integrase
MPLYRNPRSPYWWYSILYQGKRFRASTGELTKAKANTIMADAITKLSKGEEHRRNRRPTLQEFSAEFLAWANHTRTLEPNTRRYYNYGWRLLQMSELAFMPIDQITKEITDCVQFRRPVIDRKTGLPGITVPCSDSYTAQALRTLKVMLGKAEEKGLILRRPKISPPSSVGRDLLIDHDAERALERELRPQAWLVILVMQDSGMRPEEVFAMRKENLRWSERRIWIPEGKTAKARRFVGMTERMHKMLSAWCYGEDTGWVFPSKSKSGHIESIAKSFKAAAKRALLDPKLVPYAARHAYGTFAMRATGNTFAVMKQMGHASLKSMEPYQHQEIDQLLTAVNERNSNRGPQLVRKTA